MANRPGYAGYRRADQQITSSSPSSNSPSYGKLPGLRNDPPPPTPPPTLASTKTTGPPVAMGNHIDSAPKQVEPPRPAPRRTTSQSQPSETNRTSTPVERTANLDSDSASQVLPKPITNEDFQAMIPAHFLNPSLGQNSSQDSTSTVTVTIKNPETHLPEDLSFPPAPTGLGKVTETITKSTFTEKVVTRVTDNKLVESVIIEEVALLKEGGSLGFSIIGGTDHSCTPFGAKEPGIFISHVVPGGIAAKSGKLRMGDRILQVNGEDITKLSHQEAVMLLLKHKDEIRLTVQHDPLPEGFQALRIVKAPGEKLGMHIKGGLRGHRGNPLDRTDEGVFISKINSGGAAKRDGRLKVGMRLLEVNGVSLLGASHQEAVNVLRSCGNDIHIAVCKGYEKADVERLMSEGRLSRESKSVSQSVSSLDREDESSVTIRQEEEMKQELVQWEKEEEDQQREIVAAKEKSTPDRVLEVVRAVETLVNKPSSPTDMQGPPKSPGGSKSQDLKTTTIVMSKHTLAPQAGSPVPADSSTLPHARSAPPVPTPAPQYATLPGKHPNPAPLHAPRSPPPAVPTKPPVAAKPVYSDRSRDSTPPPPQVTNYPPYAGGYPPAQVGYPPSQPAMYSYAIPFPVAQFPPNSQVPYPHYAYPVPPAVPPPPPPVQVISDGSSSSNDEEDSVDPIARSKMPSARLTGRSLHPLEVGLGVSDESPHSPAVNNGVVPAMKKMSVSDKMKFFEKAMEEQHQPSPKPEKVFSFISADELELMKQEEERKIAALSKEELKSWTQLDEVDEDAEEEGERRPTIKVQPAVTGMGSIRTAKAERRMKEKLQQEGLLSEDEDKELSPAEQRALKAEKRAAWRQARLKSLEQDALQAQIVIKEMSKMIDSKPGGGGYNEENRSSANTNSIGNKSSATIVTNNNTDQENNIEQRTGLRPSSDDFPQLFVRAKEGATKVNESERVVGEKVTRKTEEYVDELTGERKVRTVEYVEKLIEREVETLKEKIISLELTNREPELNGAEEDEGEGDDEPTTPVSPTPSEDPSVGSGTGKRRKRKRSKKGKH
uniref:(California timema) hypothetical protein n=1 Tax=Timema californicum TaxID=61474 RepID=A0A7R9IZ39_TIMCA|nr:unnamed protein product [Timema californicum]